MKTAKEIAVMGVFVALLIGGQFVLSGIQGIEVVTVLITSFCFYFGLKRGIIVATAFSLLRCFIFGFFPQVITLYLVYYNLIAVVFGLIGKAFKKLLSIKKLIVVISATLFSTALFTVLDVGLTWVFYGLTENAVKVYFIASMPTLITQLICVMVTVALLFIPLLKVYKTIKLN
ncbi:MAG: hypothetical protein J6R88_02290 [Clostridia bacterium]|nr:hypothetical protein [Clostridia bacterium]